MNIVEKAEFFATVAHKSVGQVRKYSGEDYIIHPIGVSNIIKMAGLQDDENLLAAAMLHDVVEDTHIDNDMIRHEFGDDVADLVAEVTNPSKEFPELNRAERKDIDLLHLSGISNRAMALKLADIVHNAPTIIRDDPEFAKIWVPEAFKIVEAIKSGSGVLYAEAMYILHLSDVINDEI